MKFRPTALVLVALGSCGPANAPEDVSKWQPVGCEFEIEFPGTPEEKTNEVPGGAQFIAAQLVRDGGVFGANCMALTPAIRAQLPSSNEDITRAVLNDNIQKSGMTPLEFSYSERDGYFEGIARGNKSAQGGEVMIKIKVAVGANSVMGAMVGAPASEFPKAGQSQFLETVKQVR